MEELIKKQNTENTIKFLRNYNEWRRGSDIDQPHPEDIGKYIDLAIELLEAK